MSDYKQTRDAAAKVTAQYDKMLRKLGDDLVKRLREHAHWGMTVEAADSIEQLVATCEELEDNLASMAGLWAKSDSEKQLLLGRIEELEAKLKTAEEIGRAFEEDAGQLRDKLAKLRTFLDELWDSQGYDARELHDLLNELDDE